MSHDHDLFIRVLAGNFGRKVSDPPFNVLEALSPSCPMDAVFNDIVDQTGEVLRILRH